MVKEQQDRYIRMKEVVEISGIGRSTLYELLSKGEFIERHIFSPRVVCFRLSELMLWLSGHRANKFVDKK